MALRVLLSIQGCGRGHITQAIAFERILAGAGHEVVGILVGTERPGDVPSYLTDRIDAPTESFRSPLIEVSKDARSLDWRRTAMKSMAALPSYAGSVRQIIAAVDRHCPDLVVNFFEPLTGLAMVMRRTVPVLAVAHQFMFLHPRYPFTEGSALERRAMAWYTRLTSISAARRLALSFYPAESLERERLRVTPPLLRRELSRLGPTADESFILVYAWIAEMVPHILDWHDRHPDVRMEAFIPGSGFRHVRPHADTLKFQALHDTLFLERMNVCSGVITTAGFESTAEAFYLGKPIFMVPTHIEQQCNARDAALYGSARCAETFDPDPFIRDLPHLKSDNRMFRAWLERGPSIVIEEVERAVSARRTGAQRRVVGRPGQRTTVANRLHEGVPA